MPSNPELVTADDLSAFASRDESRELLPRLVQRLLVASSAGRVSIRTGAGTALPGFDGTTTVGPHSPVLPPGPYAFELSNEAQSRAKAQADYAKRTAAISEVERRDLGFVFVTMRRWSQKDTWAKEYRSTGEWRDVVALDADGLEAWLLACPGVHIWLSEQMGRSPLDVRTAEHWWERWSRQTDPPTPRGLLMAGKGRDSEVQGLSAWLEGTEGKIVFVGKASQEALAFVAASVTTMPGAEGSTVPTVVFVRTGEAWERLCTAGAPLILVPEFADADVAFAIDRGCRVVVCSTARAIGTTDALPDIDPMVARETLVAEGWSFEKATAAAHAARRSLASWRRSCAVNPAASQPPWAAADGAAQRAPVLLVTGWRRNADADGEVVAAIAGRPVEDFEADVVRWTEDPLAIRSGDSLTLAEPLDAWRYLSPALADGPKDRWAERAMEVLGERDPLLDIPFEDRLFASWQGVRRAFSHTFRSGLAEGAVLLGIAGETRAPRVVRSLLQRANEDPSGNEWRSLRDVLPLLAEADPEEFLSACEAALDQKPSPITPLFAPDLPELLSRPDHVELLWALECLAWSSDWMPRACHVLARLAERDPGGTSENRPRRSLRGILLPWHPCTNAPQARRVEMIKQLFRTYPDVGWRLVVDLLPRAHDVAFPTSRPRFREWDTEVSPVLIAELRQHSEEMFALAVQGAEATPSRWVELLEHLDSVSESRMDQVIGALSRLTREGLGSDADALWEKLNGLVGKHRTYASEDWAWPPRLLDRLDDVATALAPDLPSIANAWLFEWAPDIPGDTTERDAEYFAHVGRLQDAALREVIDREGLQGVRTLAGRVKAPNLVGHALARIEYPVLAADVADALSEDGPVCDALLTWVRARHVVDGAGWASAYYVEMESCSERARALFLLGLNVSPSLWALLDEEAPAVRSLYWSRAGLPGPDCEVIDEFARRALEAGRPWLALEALALYRERPAADPAARRALVVDVLRAARTDPSVHVRASPTWEVGQLLDYLESSGADENTLIELEVSFARFLRKTRRPRTVERELLAHPASFVAAAREVFRPARARSLDVEDQEASSPEAVARAEAFYEVLEGLDSMPGLQDDRLDADSLRSWVTEARARFEEADRKDIGDSLIGKLLAFSPTGGDGAWPAEPVRDLIDEAKSDELDGGFCDGHAKRRGITWRGALDGGDQEREIEARLLGWAATVEIQWPRTGRVLRRLARQYRSDAKREDSGADHRANAR